MATLYVIATPIGNLDDISNRALRKLAEVDLICAEDTRVTVKLLNHYGISKRLLPWHEHSKRAQWLKVKEVLEAGKDVAVVTDSGTPGVSDPGGKLVELVVEELPHVTIVPIPGASALTAAISAAGIPLNEFLFLGFLPHKKGRQKKLKLIADSVWPIILFESVHRIEKLLGELTAIDKEVIVCRELTKKFETLYRGSAYDVLASIPRGEIKGEFVIIVYKKKHG